ncbi:mechanosensitive ion channel domain-containing protein [uncultured Algibacter sp.]|uniref:mechanosensitive ion channel domain-containing protein n=1 Tax=uncultured Algibacter sp. TaxID=298659 RepID=UPI0026217A15|nr:mechanosensitive ion channel domain-containing protein [uncultured Algibacter sp.]
MFTNFINAYREELIISGFVIGILFILRLITIVAVRKLGRKSGIYKARIRLICRYVTGTAIILALIIESFIFGAQFRELIVIFSSVFAVLGIALFAVWSILSNVTSGIIMFFNFPFKVGDKINIHDKDFPVEAIIEDIRAFHLYLRLNNGDLITYPNNLMLQKAVSIVEKDAIEDVSKDDDVEII